MEAWHVSACQNTTGENTMEYRDVLQYKPLECNPYERYYRKIVRIQPVGAKKASRVKLSQSPTCTLPWSIWTAGKHLSGCRKLA